LPISAAQEAEMMLFKPETMKPKKNKRIESEIWLKNKRWFESVKPRTEATQTAIKEIGERLE